MKVLAARRGALLWGSCATVVLLGIAVTMVGVLEGGTHLVFGGVVMLLLGVAFLLSGYVLRPGVEGALPARAEKTAWSMLAFCMTAMLVLGQMAFGSDRPRVSSYLILSIYVLIMLCLPLFRRRWLEQEQRRSEVLEDERDHAIRLQGTYWSKRSLEFAIAALAMIWVLFPQVIPGLDNSLQIGALLLLLILAANAVGEAVIAGLYWRGRQ